jgi:hypothetical protein
MYSGGQWVAAPNSSGGVGLWSQGAGDDIYYNSGTPMVGIGTTNPTAELHVVGDINVTGGLNDISDIRLKENIAPVEDALAKLLQLNVISFTMKDDAKHRTEYGFSAQQMLDIYPALVRTADDERQTLSLNYMGLIGPLTRAIQEQQLQIDDLQQRLKAMESRYGSPLEDQQNGEQ